MNCPPEVPITPEDWEKTPAPVQGVIVMLWQEIPKLKEQVEKLQERLNKNFLYSTFSLSLSWLYIHSIYSSQ